MRRGTGAEPRPAAHIAQLNLMKAVAPLDSAVMSGFANLLAPMHELAEQSPGFAWRFQGVADDASEMPVTADGHTLVNLSTWQSIDDLWNYTYATAHLELLRRRREWTDRIAEHSLALWWIPADRPPTLDESLERLEMLRRDGPTPWAFTFRQTFPPPESVREGLSGVPLRSQPG